MEGEGANLDQRQQPNGSPTAARCGRHPAWTPSIHDRRIRSACSQEL